MRRKSLAGARITTAIVLLGGLTAPIWVPAALSQGSVAGFEVVGGAIPRPLTPQPGDAVRGRAIALDRSKGNCITCHAMPVDAAFQGDLGPPLAGVADRYEPGELRLRLVDSKRINPDSNMPPYHRVEGLLNVRRQYAGRPILTAQEVEDVLAYLLTLR